MSLALLHNIINEMLPVDPANRGVLLLPCWSVSGQKQQLVVGCHSSFRPLLGLLLLAAAAAGLVGLSVPERGVSCC